jgi:hypothetical protein
MVKYYSSDQIKRTVMGRACTTHEEEDWTDAYGILMEKPEERSHFDDPSVIGKTILKWIFEKWDGRAWTESIWLRIGTGDELL